MPPKDFDADNVKLYFEDDNGNIVEATAHIGEKLIKVDDSKGFAFPIQSHKDFSATVKTQSSALKQLLVVSGFKDCVPNNWLKRHGYPMNRRRF